MNLKEAKIMIAKEFIEKYLEWINDYNNQELSDFDYGRKYGWRRNTSEQTKKDLQKNMIWFQSHIFSGKYIPAWKKENGIELQMLVALHREGFLSYDYCTSWKARQLGKTDFYYINQAKAKDIYRAYKNGFFENIQKGAPQ